MRIVDVTSGGDGADHDVGSEQLALGIVAPDQAELDFASSEPAGA